MFSTPMDRHCEECKRPLKGRKDQKFCSDYCRNTYNNRQNEDSNKYVRKVNNILRRNRRILGNLLRNKEISKDLQELAELGFNFRYYTNTLTGDDGNPLYFCYELGYKREGEMRCKIIEKII